MEAPPVVRLVGISKAYGAVQALDEVKLDLVGGQAQGLVGENGAGKSTLVKILAGAEQADTGEVEIDGELARLDDPAAARDAGIAVIYQEPTLFPDLSVAENIFMGRQPLRSLGRIDHDEITRRTRELFDRLGHRIDPQRPARGLSIADQQLVEIAKALSLDARVLVMDEPTAALSGVEVDRLFEVARTLRDEGAAILFISHRFDEVFDLCDTVTVLRDGSWVSTDPADELTNDALVRRMVGRDIDAMFPKQEAEVGDVVLEVTGLTRAGVFSDVDLEVRSGEIVALAGLVGAGRSEVVRAIFGIDSYDAGKVRVAGTDLPGHRPAAAMAAGISLVPEDRRQQGLVMDLSIERNMTLTRRKELARLGLLRRADEHAAAAEWAERMEVKAGSLIDPVLTLSGGNQQKVVLGKWLSTNPRLLIVDEPTRGIDVGTKAEVHRFLSELATQGVAILMVSSELPEVLGMADRVLVMHEGRIADVLSRDEADEESVMFAATGQAAA